jgi:hypothetical protein
MTVPNGKAGCDVGAGREPDGEAGIDDGGRAVRRTSLRQTTATPTMAQMDGTRRVHTHRDRVDSLQALERVLRYRRWLADCQDRFFRDYYVSCEILYSPMVH